MSELISPVLLSKYLGQEHAPTPQQAEIIGAEPGPLLVVAGAGAGKTETMAARVVWLVANGFATPDQILGLTFTRKAAQGLSQRIRKRLEVLAGIPKLRDLDPSGKLTRDLQAITPTVSTYDSYAGRLIREYGLLAQVEPSARLITATEQYQIAAGLVREYRGRLDLGNTEATVIDKLLQFSGELDNHMVDWEELGEESLAFTDNFLNLPKAPRQADKPTQKMQSYLDVQQHRLDFLPLVRELKQELKARNVITFGEQMSLAAGLAENHPQVGASQRRRFRVIMLDEYQDTGHSQRVLLRSLFGTGEEGLTVTAVGDPMQSIYGWRGATSANLEAFVHDFPLPDGSPSPKKELTISWRNPPEVLELANAVSREVLGEGEKRTVQPLEPRPGADAGEVRLEFHDTAVKERESVADWLAEHFHAQQSAGKKFTGAVLVRKNASSPLIAEELTKLGIPNEIVGLSGLLYVPEVADVVAVATMLVKPQDTSAALRILAGPHVGLGAKDILALSRRAANLAGRATREPLERTSSEDPLELLADVIAETLPADPEEVVGLADAVADLGEPERYSPVGYFRLRQLAAELRHLRTRNLSHSLSDLFAEIEDVIGVRTEVLARQEPGSDGAVSTTHLDRLAEEVAAFGMIPGATLRGLLTYFEQAKASDKGLDPGEVTVRSDRVQIMTVHKAKGLEWGHVAVMHADDRTYSAKAETWLTRVEEIPAALRGDADSSPQLEGGAENRKEFELACKEYLGQVRQAQAEENTRLFYVAITRAESALMVSASELSDTGTTCHPYENLEILRQIVPPATWFGEGTDAEGEAPQLPAPAEGYFPDLEVSPGVAEGAELVHEALRDIPRHTSDGGLFDLWERETSALIEEYEALSAAEVKVPLTRELTATDLVALKNNPEQFAKRMRRPVPFKPNTYAKRGTAFHQWLEDRFGATALLDEDQLPGLGEEEVSSAELVHLKDAFLDSQWAERTPEFVEQPFEVSIGDRVVRGRMDAVFRQGDEWLVVDWKTGQPPSGPEMRAAIIQLAVYRLAWAQLRTREGEPAPQVRAAFHYVGQNHTFEPDVIPDAAELAALIEQGSTRV
ncbi:ATP-dependent DNA helicase UvrD1 [Corynebacterium occultum]|uniref:DNA 3'-5' helicase n=1 Tax=Corynebacterium occultum TaxID=2675219 RepID=A0A6B8W3Y9_9CORY|nr:UvrD-helicase domain-containing protein [Corynebacterium occultum]QGU06657.1 ATP-dependent DNA helicase UvrD1 [Corynebacterium occultum]